MSFGFRSAARFVATVPSVWPTCTRVPPASSGPRKLEVEKVELSIGTPSTTNSGWFEPRIELVPRMLMKDPAPGSPDCWITVTLGALPASAWTMLASPAFAIKSAPTLLRTLPSFSVELVVPAPVTTTSPSCSGLAASTKSCVTPPAVSVTWALCDL